MYNRRNDTIYNFIIDACIPFIIEVRMLFMVVM